MVTIVLWCNLLRHVLYLKRIRICLVTAYKRKGKAYKRKGKVYRFRYNCMYVGTYMYVYDTCYEVGPIKGIESAQIY